METGLQEDQPTGLSLCIQGTLKNDYKVFCEERFIPVYTGNSGNASRTFWSFTVYPCVYRELVMKLSYIRRCNGLSLCIQGTLRFFCSSSHSIRFIPVYTGNSIVDDSLIPRMPVYPCVYRELQIKWLKENKFCGLSLCIQGTPS